MSVKKVKELPINSSEVNNAITFINKPSKQKLHTITMKYNVNGQSDAQLNKTFKDEECCAIKIKSTPQSFFKVKVDRRGDLYNPLLENFSYSLNRKDRLTNEAMFSFKEVNEKAFNNYLRFLETRYDSHLRAAQREV